MDIHSVPQKQHIIHTEHDIWQTPDFIVGSTWFINLIQIANCLKKGDGFLWRFVTIISVCHHVILAFIWRE